MEQMLELLGYGRLCAYILAQVARHALLTLAVLLVGPVIALYAYDFGLYMWRVVTNGWHTVEENSLSSAGASEQHSGAQATHVSEGDSENDSDVESTYRSGSEWESSVTPAEIEEGELKPAPLLGVIQGSYSRLSDLITVTVSTGADSRRVECYEHEVKLVSGRS